MKLWNSVIDSRCTELNSAIGCRVGMFVMMPFYLLTIQSVYMQLRLYTIQEDLIVACNWPKECCLSFNCNKSAALHFWCHHQTQLSTYVATYKNNYIEVKDSIKNLEMMLTSEFSGTGHCNIITSRAYK